MNKQEFSRLDVLLRVRSGRLRVTDACVLIGLQRRQAFRLLRGLKQNGATEPANRRAAATGVLRECGVTALSRSAITKSALS
jgi:hypothetical protein